MKNRAHVVCWLFAGILLSCLAVADSLDHRMDLAVRHLVGAQLDSGYFRYEYDFIKGRNSSKNNIVRQAGTAFALAEYHAAHPGEKLAKQSVERALEAFRSRSIAWGTGQLIAPDGSILKAKAGATALALLSLLLVAGDQPTGQQQRLIDLWLQGLLALQTVEGGFESKPGSGVESPYSNGEIWLVLAHMAERFPNDQHWQSALQRADRYFIEFYSKNPNIGFFHWGVMAASQRYETTGDSRFARFAAAQIHDYITRMRPEINLDSNSCYAVEGLLAGVQAFDRHMGFPTIRDMVMQRAAAEMEKNLGLQIGESQTRLYFDRDRYLAAADISRQAGAFLNGRYRPRVRIDATQHCLSAMLKMRRMQAFGDSQ